MEFVNCRDFEEENKKQYRLAENFDLLIVVRVELR